jgi:putative hydrolase of the HAD superfamily
MQNSDIKAIIFDYGEVLNVPTDVQAVQELRARLASRLGISADKLWPYLYQGQPARLWMTGKLTWNEFWEAVLRPKGIEDPDEIEAFAQSATSNSHQVNEEMKSLLATLRGRYRLALLSNASWTQEELADRLYHLHGIPEGTFDAVISSTSAGYVKPDREIYELALARLGVRPEATIFIDDLASFTRAAAELGLHAHTFTTPAALRQYLVEHGVRL